MTKKHTLKIVKLKKNTGEVLETSSETFYSIYNLNRRKFEVEDQNDPLIRGTFEYQAIVEKIAA